MNELDILHSATDKAVQNGYEVPFIRKLYKITSDPDLIPFTHYNIIFSHDFAKAFWGGEEYAAHLALTESSEGGLSTIRTVPSWQYHLQQMVLCEDPIEYLAKFIEE